MKRYQFEMKQEKQDMTWLKVSLVLLTLLSTTIALKMWHDGIFFFEFESKKQDAVVEEVNWHAVKAVLGVEYIQSVRYSYVYNNHKYDGYQEAGVSIGKLFKGDTIEIEVLNRKPSISRIYISTE